MLLHFLAFPSDCLKWTILLQNQLENIQTIFPLNFTFLRPTVMWLHGWTFYQALFQTMHVKLHSRVYPPVFCLQISLHFSEPNVLELSWTIPLLTSSVMVLTTKLADIQHRSLLPGFPAWSLTYLPLPFFSVYFSTAAGGVPFTSLWIHIMCLQNSSVTMCSLFIPNTWLITDIQYFLNK